MNDDKKNFIQEYINQLKREIYLYTKGSSDETSLFDIITEISGVFSKEFPDLQKDLAFNNGTAVRDARIVLGLLNKELIEDSNPELSNIDQSQFRDILNQLKIEVGSFRSTALTWEKNGNIGNYFEQLEQALNNNNIKSIKYCLHLINEWYVQNLDRIINSRYCPHKNEHKNNADKIKVFLEKSSLIPDNYIIENNDDKSKIEILNEPIIFISHSSCDKKYGDALRNFIIGLGIKKEQLVYSSHPLHKIPLGQNIYDYLRSRINNTTFMIFLLSKSYLDSTVSLNEMGAAWLAQTDYLNFYVPNFDFGDNKYLKCAIDKNKMGIKLDISDDLRISMIEFKDKLVELFKINTDEATVSNLIDIFIKEIK